MSKRNNIILIGFMGSGKTTFGKWIAANKKMEFVDTDELIEKENGITISDIFASKGEVYFRNLETDMLNKLLERDTQNCVISVGGGLPVKEENRALLSQLGTVVYLWADADELVKRLSGDNTRPLLAGGNLKERINTLMDARKEIYDSVSDIKIDTKDIAFNDMFSQMEEFLQKNM